ncbi:MAG: sodium:solute symporter family protein [Alphaproteobacteria bacterium]|nr:sodium:solute symporter family protein [Alphaproteobacteria bacterium]
MDGGFLNNLGKVYTYYTGGFAAFVVLIAILEQLGMPSRWLGYLYMAATIGVYAFIGIVSRTGEMSEYYVAGRKVPAFYNGMATAADWMSAASFIGMAGSFYLLGYNGLAFALGWTGGFVLVAVLMAPFLRKFGQYTVPDFLGARFGGNVARLIGVVVLITASFVYVVAQIVGVGIIASRFLGMAFEIAVFVGLVGILVCSMMGGMKAVTWTQVAQYIILIIAYLIPVTLLSAKFFGVPIPQLMYGFALERIEGFEKTLGVAQSYVAPFINARGQFDMTQAMNFFFLVFCLMLGTASLPHVLMRFFTTPSVREARTSVAWTLIFVGALYLTAPAYAAFARLEVYQNVIGQPIASLPAWVQSWGAIGLVGACDAPNAATIFSLCRGVAGNGDGILQVAEFRIHADAIVLATPEIAGLPYVIAGLVAAGGLAAALSTADGLLLAQSNALSHDLYYRMINPNADTAKRLQISKILLVVVALVAAWVAGSMGADILFLVAWAFSIAAAGLFAPLVLGIWSKNTTSAGAVAGMIVGFGVTLTYLIWTEFFGPSFKAFFGDAANISAARGRQVANLWGINNISGGIFGVPLAFLVTYVVSQFTEKPSKEMQEFIESIRIPKGAVREVGTSRAVE